MVTKIRQPMPDILRCDECAFTTTSLNRFASHQQAHTGLDQVACFRCTMPGCDFTTKTESHLRRHQTALCREIEDESLLCDPCDYLAKSRADLDAHKKVHTPFLCSWDSCGYIGPHKTRLRRHEARHSIKTPFLCFHASCQFTSNSREALDEHRSARNHFPSTTTKNHIHSCPRKGCKFATLYVYGLARHERRQHRGESPLPAVQPKRRPVSMAVRHLSRDNRLSHRSLVDIGTQTSRTPSPARSLFISAPPSLEDRSLPDQVSGRKRKRENFVELFGSSDDEEDESENAGSVEEDDVEEDSDEGELEVIQPVTHRRRRHLRYTEDDMERNVRLLQEEIARLRARLAAQGCA
ncbi:hypothetical protein CYLTODRAFT_489361 [Cylindrobasidium torrendii FP15055 ss-10]|uniref:C2H2-type domain-containing protein n=1 Tax=Cylindrobasidium torrendii FP15055 ss-10 TaxID=1314674 RepID=A0A0D7BFG3_9AGAR|nr:hypothetical protein CYLTODRAFT_489361 [Cylindrobasidium torrendii FP15055 ss-10]